MKKYTNNILLSVALGTAVLSLNTHESFAVLTQSTENGVVKFSDDGVVLGDFKVEKVKKAKGRSAKTVTCLFFKQEGDANFQELFIITPTATATAPAATPAATATAPATTPTVSEYLTGKEQLLEVLALNFPSLQAKLAGGATAHTFRANLKGIFGGTEPIDVRADKLRDSLQGYSLKNADGEEIIRVVLPDGKTADAKVSRFVANFTVSAIEDIGKNEVKELFKEALLSQAAADVNNNLFKLAEKVGALGEADGGHKFLRLFTDEGTNTATYILRPADLGKNIQVVLLDRLEDDALKSSIQKFSDSLKQVLPDGEEMLDEYDISGGNEEQYPLSVALAHRRYINDGRNFIYRDASGALQLLHGDQSQKIADDVDDVQFASLGGLANSNQEFVSALSANLDKLKTLDDAKRGEIKDILLKEANTRENQEAKEKLSIKFLSELSPELTEGDFENAKKPVNEFEFQDKVSVARLIAATKEELEKFPNHKDIAGPLAKKISWDNDTTDPATGADIIYSKDGNTLTVNGDNLIWESEDQNMTLANLIPGYDAAQKITGERGLAVENLLKARKLELIRTDDELKDALKSAIKGDDPVKMLGYIVHDLPSSSLALSTIADDNFNALPIGERANYDEAGRVVRQLAFVSSAADASDSMKSGFFLAFNRGLRNKGYEYSFASDDLGASLYAYKPEAEKLTEGAEIQGYFDALPNLRIEENAFADRNVSNFMESKQEVFTNLQAAIKTNDPEQIQNAYDGLDNGVSLKGKIEADVEQITGRKADADRLNIEVRIGRDGLESQIAEAEKLFTEGADRTLIDQVAQSKDTFEFGLFYLQALNNGSFNVGNFDITINPNYEKMLAAIKMPGFAAAIDKVELLRDHLGVDFKDSGEKQDMRIQAIQKKLLSDEFLRRLDPTNLEEDQLKNLLQTSLEAKLAADRAAFSDNLNQFVNSLPAKLDAKITALQEKTIPEAAALPGVTFTAEQTAALTVARTALADLATADANDKNTIITNLAAQKNQLQGVATAFFAEAAQLENGINAFESTTAEITKLNNDKAAQERGFDLNAKKTSISRALRAILDAIPDAATAPAPADPDAAPADPDAALAAYKATLQQRIDALAGVTDINGLVAQRGNLTTTLNNPQTALDGLTEDRKTVLEATITQAQEVLNEIEAQKTAIDALQTQIADKQRDLDAIGATAVGGITNDNLAAKTNELAARRQLAAALSSIAQEAERVNSLVQLQAFDLGRYQEFLTNSATQLDTAQTAINDAMANVKTLVGGFSAESKAKFTDENPKSFKVISDFRKDSWTLAFKTPPADPLIFDLDDHKFFEDLLFDSMKDVNAQLATTYDATKARDFQNFVSSYHNVGMPAALNDLSDEKSERILERVFEVNEQLDNKADKNYELRRNVIGLGILAVTEDNNFSGKASQWLDYDYNPFANNKSGSYEAQFEKISGKAIDRVKRVHEELTTDGFDLTPAASDDFKPIVGKAAYVSFVSEKYKYRKTEDKYTAAIEGETIQRSLDFLVAFSHFDVATNVSNANYDDSKDILKSIMASWNKLNDLIIKEEGDVVIIQHNEKFVDMFNGVTLPDRITADLLKPSNHVAEAINKIIEAMEKDSDSDYAKYLKAKEAEKAEKERLEKEAKEKAEKERLRKEAEEKERLRKEAEEKAEKERLEKEAKEKARLEKEAEEERLRKEAEEKANGEKGGEEESQQISSNSGSSSEDVPSSSSEEPSSSSSDGYYSSSYEQIEETVSSFSQAVYTRFDVPVDFVQDVSSFQTDVITPSESNIPLPESGANISAPSVTENISSEVGADVKTEPVSPIFKMEENRNESQSPVPSSESSSKPRNEPSSVKASAVSAEPEEREALNAESLSDGEESASEDNSAKEESSDNKPKKGRRMQKAYGNAQVKKGFWFEGSIGSAEQKQNKEKTNKEYKANSNAFAIGFDAELVDGIVAGLSYSNANNKITFSDKTQEKHNYNIVSLYGQAVISGGFSIEALGGYGLGSIKAGEVKRDVSLAFAKSFVKYNFLVGDSFIVAPKVGVDYVTSTQKIKDSKDKPVDFDKLSGVFGMSFKTFINSSDNLVISPELHFECDYKFSGSASKSLDQAAIAKTDEAKTKESKLTTSFGGSLSINRDRAQELTIGGDYLTRKDFNSYRGYVKVKVNF